MITVPPTSLFSSTYISNSVTGRSGFITLNSLFQDREQQQHPPLPLDHDNPTQDTQDNNNNNNNLYVSLVIATTYNDFKCFAERFFNFLYTSVEQLPQEVVVVVSGVPVDVNVATAEHLYKQYYDVSNNITSTRVYFSHTKRNAASNRNVGSVLTQNMTTLELRHRHILTFFDMDDLPHPQRFSVIRHGFTKYAYIDGALFSYYRGTHTAAQQFQFPWINLTALPAPYSIPTIHEKYDTAYAKLNFSRPKKGFLCCGKQLGFTDVKSNLANGWGTYRKPLFMKYMYNQTLHVGEDTDLATRLLLNKENVTFWNGYKLGFYEGHSGRIELCGRDPGALH